MSKVIYPGTFDPITNGHVNLIQRASKMFDEVIVAIAESQQKQPNFTADERHHLAQLVLSDFNNVEVMVFSELLVDLAKKHQAQVIIRGVRGVSDFEYEFQLASMNRQLSEEIETLLMMPLEKYAFVSSSLIREIVTMGGNISKFVPECVEQALNKKYGGNN